MLTEPKTKGFSFLSSLPRQDGKTAVLGKRMRKVIGKTPPRMFLDIVEQQQEAVPRNPASVCDQVGLRLDRFSLGSHTVPHQESGMGWPQRWSRGHPSAGWKEERHSTACLCARGMGLGEPRDARHEAGWGAGDELLTGGTEETRRKRAADPRRQHEGKMARDGRSSRQLAY